jgi:hypothetical protein
MSHQFPQHDPDAVLDYTLNWSAWLASDTITASTWVAPSGVTVDSDTHTTTHTTAWIRSETSGSYTLTNRITTAGGRTDDRSVSIWVKER